MASKWTDFTVPGLKKQCEERGISKTGTKQELIRKIEEHDEKLRQPPAHDARRRRPDIERFQDHSPIGRRGERKADPARGVPDHYRPRYDGVDRVSRPNEEELEKICRENYVRYELDPYGTERKARIIADYNIEAEKLKKARDAAETRYKNGMSKIIKDKDDKLDEAEIEIAFQREKRKNWGPAYTQLKAMRAARGLDTRPNDYAPRPPFTSPLPHRSSNQMSPSSSTTGPTTSMTSGTKRKASESDFTSISTPAPAFRDRDSNNNPFAERRPAPPTMQTEPEPIMPQLVDTPFIFLSRDNIRFREGNIQHMQNMVEGRFRALKHVRADGTGYFIVFESNFDGEHSAEACYEHFQGREFRGVRMKMQLYRLGSSRGVRSD